MGSWAREADNRQPPLIPQEVPPQRSSVTRYGMLLFSHTFLAVWYDILFLWTFSRGMSRR